MTEEEKFTIPEEMLFNLPLNGFGVLWSDSVREDYAFDSELEPILPQDLFLKDLESNFEFVDSNIHQTFDHSSVVAGSSTSSTFHTIKCEDNPVIARETSSGVTVLENLPAGTSDTPEVIPVASLVATNNWVGDYGFNTYFEEIKQCSTRTKWTYSPLKDKLYVKRDTPCPVKFKTDHHMPYNTKIRAMAVFDQAQYASEVVQRCYNHFRQDNSQHIPFANHLIKCESDQAIYEEDPITKRLSVVIQYENPQSGEEHSTYIFKFTCLGSCVGGLNRRPITVVFTLENGGRIIGRRSMALRLCACPHRDRMIDENVFNAKEEKFKKGGIKTKRKCPKSDNEEHGLLSTGNPSNKKAKCRSTPPNGPYCIRVDDYRLYLSLKKLQEMYLTYGAWDKLLPHIQQANIISSTSSESSSAEEKRSSEESDF